MQTLSWKVSKLLQSILLIRLPFALLCVLHNRWQFLASVVSSCSNQFSLKLIFEVNILDFCTFIENAAAR
jgi:hypothetical protein